jgi:16S rRNA processing protein RimM
MQPHYTCVGTITKAHGIKGELVIQLIEPIRLATQSNTLDYIFIKIGATLVPHRIEAMDLGPQKLVIKLQDIDSRTETYALIKQTAWIPTALLRKDTQRDESADLKGYEVIDNREGKLGLVEHIDQFPMHQCLVIMYKGKELLIPYQEPIVEQLNHERKQIFIDLPQGFLQAQGHVS